MNMPLKERSQRAVLIFIYLFVFCFEADTLLSHNPFSSAGNETLRSTRTFSPKMSSKMKAGRWDYFFRMLRDPATNQIPADIREKELRFARQLAQIPMKMKPLIPAGQWKEAGPSDVGGRTRALAVDITNSNIIIAGGASGGIWKSTDHGNTWTLKSTSSQIMGITSLAQDPRPGHTNTWYYTTGEFTGSAQDMGWRALYYGNGVYKSTDNGESWKILPGTEASNPTAWSSYFSFCICVIVSPVTGSVFVASNGLGIFRSADGGNSFTMVLGGINEHMFSDITVAGNGTLLAAISSGPQGSSPKNTPGIYKSTDNGTTWTSITPSDFPTVHQRTALCIAPSNPDVAYALTYAGKNSKGNEVVQFYKLKISSGTFENRSQNMPDFGYALEDFINTQNNYNMVIAVKPDDENFVLIGATSLFRSRNGFASKPGSGKLDWIGGYHPESFFYPGLHPDIHSFSFDPFDPNKMWWGHDGGLSYTSDIRNAAYEKYFPWENKNNGYNVTQFYHISIPAVANDNRIMGGTQDNGTPYFTFDGTTSTPFTDVSSGDGGYSYFAKNYAYTSSQYGKIRRLHYDAGGNVLWASEGYSVINPKDAANQLFVNPFAIDPNNEDVMFYPAGTELWRNTQLSSIPEYENTTTYGWEKLSGFTLPQGYQYSALAVSSSAPSHILYCAASSSTSAPMILKLVNAHSSGASPVKSSIPGISAGAYIHNIAVNPADGNEIIVVLSNYNVKSIYYSSDGGTSFTGIEGNLDGTTKNPGPSVRAAAIMPAASGKIYFAATSIGLFSTTAINGESTQWIQESGDKIGTTVVNSIAVRPADGKIIAGTHGRGAFTANITTSGTAIASIDILKLNITATAGQPGSSSFTLRNSGTADLTFNISCSPAGGTVPAHKASPGYKTHFSKSQQAEIIRKSASISTRPKPHRLNTARISNEDVLYLDDGNDTPDTFIGYGNWSEFSWANEFRLEGYGFDLKRFQVFMRTEDALANSISYYIYGDSLEYISYGTAFLQLSSAGAWFTVDLDKVYSFSSGQTFFIRVDNYNLSNYPAGYDLNAVVKNRSYYIRNLNEFVNMNTVQGSENGAFLIRAVGTKTGGTENQPPVAIGTISKNEAVIGESVTFDASQSYDPDGQIASYRWDFGDGQSSTSSIAAHVYNNAGTYTVSLLVTDDKGATDQGSAQIKINPSGTNIAPTAVAAVSKNSAMTGEELTFDASQSYDPDGSIVRYQWKFGDGSESDGQIVKHSYASASKYTFTLTVTDDKQSTGETTGQITIDDKPSRFTITPSSGTIQAGQSAEIKVTFDCAGLSDGIYQSTLTISGNGGIITLPVDITVSGQVFVNDEDRIKDFQLNQNFPNPFNAGTVISYAVPEASFVSINIYDLSGQTVRQLVNEYKAAGRHSVFLNAAGISSGVYFCRMKTEKHIITRKMVLLR